MLPLNRYLFVCLYIYIFILFIYSTCSWLLGWSRWTAYHYPWTHTCIQNQICGSCACNQGQCICCIRVRNNVFMLFWRKDARNWCDFVLLLTRLDWLENESYNIREKKIRDQPLWTISVLENNNCIGLVWMRYFHPLSLVNLSYFWKKLIFCQSTICKFYYL